MRATLMASALALTAALTAAPAFAQDGLWNQADQYYDPAEMAAARHHVLAHNGDQRFFYFEGERFEYRSHDDEERLLLDAQGWYGGDLNKAWVKLEAEYDPDSGEFEEAELQGLWSRAITPYFDLQAGLRQDLAGDDPPTHAVLGIEGLAPYWFEIDAAAFLSTDGDLTAKIEAEYELLLTQRLILQPRAEVALSAQDIPELGVGSGLSSAEAGVRLRYEFSRQFAPYLGVEWERAFGDTADFFRAEGEDPEAMSFVAGLRVWF